MNAETVEAGKAIAESIVAGLSKSPILLALVFMQTLSLGAIAWSMHERNASEHKMQELLIQYIGNK